LRGQAITPSRRATKMFADELDFALRHARVKFAADLLLPRQFESFRQQLV
jgi:hypothetical protein